MKLFIAGTDTEVGKTYISAGILNAYKKLGRSTLGIKPVASGCFNPHSDTHILQAASSIKLNSNVITPFAFEQPIAPHIAAQLTQRELNLKNINRLILPAMEIEADIKIIEGCGGWYTPLNDEETMADFVIHHRLDVVLVIGLRLGCINHSVLTVRAMQNDGVNVMGWVGNCVAVKMDYELETIITLRQRLSVPCLGLVGFGESVDINLGVSKK